MYHCMCDSVSSIVSSTPHTDSSVVSSIFTWIVAELVVCESTASSTEPAAIVVYIVVVFPSIGSSI